MLLSGASTDENVEPLVRRLTPERRLADSAENLTSPLGTAPTTLRPHF